MGRRTFTLAIRLWPEQEGRLREAADKVDLSLSDYVRGKVLGADAQNVRVRPKTKAPAHIKSLMNLAGRMQTNVGQLQCHASSDDERDLIEVVLEELVCFKQRLVMREPRKDAATLPARLRRLSDTLNDLTHDAHNGIVKRIAIKAMLHQILDAIREPRDDR